MRCDHTHSFLNLCYPLFADIALRVGRCGVAGLAVSLAILGKAGGLLTRAHDVTHSHPSMCSYSFRPCPLSSSVCCHCSCGRQAAVMLSDANRAYLVLAILSGINTKQYNDLHCRLSTEAVTGCDEASAWPAAKLPRTYDSCIGFNQQTMHVHCYRGRQCRQMEA
jgi:hypothetical protein